MRTLLLAIGILGCVTAHGADAVRVKRYYIAAEPTQWDYIPFGADLMCDLPIPPDYARERLTGKLRYFQYTDATFTTKVAETPSLGILGPVLRGVVGDQLHVTFLNRTIQPLSMHPHGVKYDKDSEGANYAPNPGKGASVAPGESFTYIWELDESSGPLPGEPSSKGWLYHSHAVGDGEINDGLIGMIIVTDPKRARPDGTPADVDRELASLFLIFDESGLSAEAKEAYEYVDNGSGIPAKSWGDIQETLEIGSRSSINGRTFANLSGLEMNEGDRVRWYVFGLGSQLDFHTAHWHGQRVVEEGRRRTDVIELMPGSMKVADLIADNPGDWLFHCHVADHMAEGMFARVTVFPRTAVGADRSPEQAFLGLGGSSLRVTRAVVSSPAGIQLEVTATVHEAFTVFRQSVAVELGGRSIAFSPGQSGAATVGGEAGGSIRITNASPQGVVYGGLMKLELTLNGTAWLQELEKLGWSAASAASQLRPIPLAIAVGDAKDATSIPLTSAVPGR